MWSKLIPNSKRRRDETVQVFILYYFLYKHQALMVPNTSVLHKYLTGDFFNEMLSGVSSHLKSES